MVDGGQLQPGILEVDHPGQRVVVELVGVGRRRRDVAAGVRRGRNAASAGHQPADLSRIAAQRVLDDLRGDLGGHSKDDAGAQRSPTRQRRLSSFVNRVPGTDCAHTPTVGLKREGQRPCYAP